MSAAASSTPRELYTNRELARLVIPLIIEQVLFLAVGTVDTMMIARLGEAAVSGVSLGDMINKFIATAFGALATGGAVVTSQALGGRRLEQARESAAHLLYLALFIGVLVMTPTFLLRRPLTRLLFGALEPTAMENTVTYLSITILAYPVISGYWACAALFRSMNQSRICMFTSFCANLLNIAGNAVFIFVLKLGVAGAAISTLLSQLISLGVMVVLLTDRRRPVWLTFRERFHPHYQVIRSILFIGIPSGVEHGLFQFGRVVMAGFITAFGAVEVAAYAVANNVSNLTNMVGTAFCLAFTTVIGQSVGTGELAVVRKYIRRMFIWAQVGYGAWAMLVVLPCTPLLVRCFSGLAPETIRLAKMLLVSHCIVGTLLWPAGFCFPCALRAANDVRFTMAASVGTMVLVRVALGWALTKILHVGAVSVWSAMLFDWVVRVVLFYWRYRSGKWIDLAHLK